MKIALASYEFRNRDIDFNLEQIFFGMGQAAALECDLVCFGEAFLQGFDACHWNYAEDASIGIPLNHKLIDQIRAYAAEMDIAVSFGMIEKNRDDLYSSYVFIAKNGEIIDVFKRNSIGWKEFVKTDQHYREGKGFGSFEYMGKTFVTALCGDMWEEANVAAIKAIPKDIVLWPSYLNYSRQQWTKEKPQFIAQAAKTGATTLFVKSHSHKPLALGGAFVFDQGKVVESLELGSKGLLIYETK